MAPDPSTGKRRLGRPFVRGDRTGCRPVLVADANLPGALSTTDSKATRVGSTAAVKDPISIARR
jgi:hypothetical protein